MILMLPFISIIIGFSTASAKEDIVLPNIPRITAEELRQMVDKGADLVVIDTRDSGKL